MGTLHRRDSWFGAVLLSFILLITFQGASYALDVTLAWEANKESNLAGYIVYYDTDSGASFPLWVKIKKGKILITNDKTNQNKLTR